MKPAEPHVRSAGHGTPVICLHASASSSRQWEALASALPDGLQLMAPDLYGHGRTPITGPGGANALDEDLALAESLLDTNEAVHLVGHSYGGAVALRLALKHPTRIRSLTLFEPAAWRILLDAKSAGLASVEILRVVMRMRRAALTGAGDDAAGHFIDYWSGHGSWNRVPQFQRDRFVAQMGRINDHFTALLADRTPASAYAGLNVPTLILSGEDGPLSGRHISRLMLRLLPRAELQILPGVGHMGPVTRPELVNPLIAGFVARHSADEVRTAALPVYNGRFAFAA